MPEYMRMHRRILWIAAFLAVQCWAFADIDSLPESMQRRTLFSKRTVAGSENRKKRNPSVDPLAAWLHGLHLDLPAVNETKFGMTFIVKDFVCGNMSITRVRSTLDANFNKPSIKIDLQGLGITCRANYSLPVASGELDAEVMPGAKASVTLALPIGKDRVPQRAKLTSCSADLSFTIVFGKSIEHRILNWIVGALRGIITTGITRQLCEELRAAAKQNLTEAIQTLNKELLPSESPPTSMPSTSAATVSSVPPGSIDWTEVDALRWANWAVDDLMGPEAIRKAVDWALNGTGSIVVPGSAEALANISLQSGASRLHIAVGLQSFSINGIDGIRSWQPLTALDSSSLEAGVTIGTESCPEIMATTKTWIDLSAEGPETDVAPNEVDLQMEFTLGVQKPSISGSIELLVDQQAVGVPRTSAQWLYGASGCLRDMLLATPSLQKFNMSLDGLSPLIYTPRATDVLLGDFAALFNNFVSLFNLMYHRHLPAAIKRFSTSERFLELANTALAEVAKPTPVGQTSCIRQEDAAIKARELPEKADWSTLLGGVGREVVDNVIDGFLAHNETNIRDALKDLEPLRVQIEDTELEFQLNEVGFGGLSQVQYLRFLQPNVADTESLSNTVDIACPTINSSWQPTVFVAASIASTDGKTKDLKVEASLPCGEAEATLRASFGLRKYMQLPLPPDPICVFAAFSEIALTSGRLNLNGPGHVLVELEGRAPEDPLLTVCSTYPRLCDRLSNFSNLHANPALAHVLEKAQALCGESLGTAAEVQQDEPEPDAAPPVWVITALAILLVTASLTGAAIASSRVAKRRAAEGRPNSLGALCCADQSSRARIFAVIISALLVSAFAFRTVSTYFLAVAWSDIVIEIEDFGKVATVHVMTFIAHLLVEQYMEAGAVFSATLFGLMSFLVAYGVIILCLVLWVTPALSQKRRPLLRAALFLSRLSFMDVVSYGHFIPIMKSELKFPFGVAFRLRCIPDVAMYVSLASTLCSIAAVQCLRWTLPPADEVSMPRVSIPEIAVLGLPVESCKRRTRRIVKISIPTFLLFLWSCSQHFKITFTQLTGDLLDPKAFGPLALTEIMWAEDRVAGFMLVLLVFIAPFTQAVAAGLSVMGNRNPAVVLLELGNTFAALDVFFAGFIACLIDLNAILVWTMNNRFGELCAMQEIFLGAGCAGASPTIFWGSTGCLIFAVIASSGFAYSCAVVDGLRAELPHPVTTSDGIQFA